MKISTLLPAALAALTLTALTTAANAAAGNDGGYITRAERSPNGKDVFVRVVKVPKAKAIAEARDCPMMKAADMCDRMTGGAPTPKG